MGSDKGCCEGNECTCGQDSGGCSCGCDCCQGQRFQRRYQTKAEQIAELEAYLGELKTEVQAVEEAACPVGVSAA